MKPVIKKQPYHYFLLMRDDREILSFRVHTSILRVLVVLFLLLLVLGAGGFVLGAHYWQANQNLTKKLSVATTELSDVRLQLEKLNNVKSLLLVTNTTLPVADYADSAVQPTTQTPPAGANGSNNNATDSVNQTPITQIQVTLDPPAKNATNATAPAFTPTLEIAQIRSEKSPVRINNFSGRVVGQNAIRIRYELSVAVPGTSIRGSTKFAAVMKDGTVHDIVPQINDEQYFSITRLKTIDTQAHLPQGVTTGDIDNIRVTVRLEDGEIFQDQYTLSGR